MERDGEGPEVFQARRHLTVAGAVPPGRCPRVGRRREEGFPMSTRRPEGFEDVHPMGIRRHAYETTRTAIRFRALAAIDAMSESLRPLADMGDAAAVDELEAAQEFAIRLLKLAGGRSTWGM
jgi:hypothetical protein